MDLCLRDGHGTVTGPDWEPGTFEHTIDYLVDNEIDLSGSDSRYNDDETRAPAYDPAVIRGEYRFGRWGISQ